MSLFMFSCYMSTLAELSEEDHDREKSRERKQEEFVRARIQSPGTWNPTDTRLLQTLLASMASPVGEEHVNVVSRVARFFPTHTVQQVENQIKYLQRRRAIAESVDT